MSGAVGHITTPWHTPWPLPGQVALVVGGSGGIGAAIARELDRAGCQVAVAGRSAERVATVAQTLRRGCGYAGCDVRKSDDVDGLFDRVLADFERIEVVVNCAGIGRASSARMLPSTTANLPEAEWHEVLETNLRGGFLVARRAAQAMIPRRQGQILDISSARGAVRGQPFAAAYCAAKMGCVALFEALAEEVRPFGIRAWSLLPEAVDTDLIANTKLAHRGVMRTERLAEVVVEMLAMPGDAAWERPLVAPCGLAAAGLAETV